MNWSNYVINKTTTLAISEAVLEKLYQYKQTGNKYEAGGILLGRVTSDYTKYEIIEISEPCNKDKRSRFSFVRNKNKAQKIVNRAFKESSGIIQYMGEWHTHPEKYPTPSSIDIKLLNDCSKQRNIPKIIFMLILGYEGDLYVGCKETGHKLKNITTKKEC
ncbi:MAG: Mov34/MPN/PAD-1 family protein [Paraclostridium sordellii]|uniref:Mov34/MPN/PAD-1 family protein n=1 Tax=Paraclostridium sordellii TaxID=1505 RepID=UPI0005E19BFE|nr:Mov34/MPN/PAD-1 family protein [Paeniclostridium sordellii]MCR1849170.1 Mov34/MPN/PAD-1 family protein [Paeniclostridium sordellii]CEO21886.1 conserved hypothetical protein [[Clostridium] sordellii] [Paeniclostridium sordellii]